MVGRGMAIAQLVPRRSLRDLLPRLGALRESLPEQSSSAVAAIQTTRLEVQRPGRLRGRPRD
jgi:hypothetical protein